MTEPHLHEPLLDVQELHAEFAGDEGVVRAVDGVSFSVARGEILGIVGESGSGKSATNLALLRLLPEPAGRVTAGRVVFDGRELLELSSREMRSIRGHRIAMIFQDPMSSLNPYLRVEEQLVEAVLLHLRATQAEARERAIALLDRVGIPDAAKRARSYPHELSGGMRQRVMIAMALLCDPDLLIADEPTTALDVTIQAQILELLLELREERALSVILITHDLGVVAGTCDRVLVMYAGRVVESAPARDLFQSPAHPYTAALLRSVPRIDHRSRGPLEIIEGLPPRLDRGPLTSCAFAPRCRLARDACWKAEPALRDFAPGRTRRCVLEPEAVR